MGHLVDDDLGPPRPLELGGPAAEDVDLVEGDAARVLHRAHVEFGHEELVVLVEGVGDAELLGEEVEPLPGDREQLLGLLLELGRQ